MEAYSQPGALRGGFSCYRAAFRRGGRAEEGDPKIHAPTLVLWGENDAVLPIAWADRLSEFFPNLTFKPVAQCGHFMMRERPELANGEIIDFVLGGTAKAQ